MKFKISSLELSIAIAPLLKAVPPKPQLPILDSILFKASKKNLVLTASDLDTTIVNSLKMDTAADKDGGYAVNAKWLSDLLKELPEQPITIEVLDETLMQISSQTGSYKHPVYSIQDYPELPDMAKDKKDLVIEPGVISTALGLTAFSMGRDDLRPALQGLFFDIKKESIIFVSTDTHRLTRYTSKTTKPNIEASFILPSSASALLKGLLSRESAPVKVSFDSKYITFTLEHISFYCRQIDANFPAYDTVIPDNNDKILTVSRSGLLNSVKLVSISADQISNQLDVSLIKNEINLSAQDVDYSISGNEICPCIYDGEPIDLGFKSKFMQEVLSTLTSDEITVKISGSTKPVIFVPNDLDDTKEDLLMLLMPLHLRR